MAFFLTLPNLSFIVCRSIKGMLINLSKPLTNVFSSHPSITKNVKSSFQKYLKKGNDEYIYTHRSKGNFVKGRRGVHLKTKILKSCLKQNHDLCKCIWSSSLNFKTLCSDLASTLHGPVRCSLTRNDRRHWRFRATKQAVQHIVWKRKSLFHLEQHAASRRATVLCISVGEEGKG